MYKETEKEFSPNKMHRKKQLGSGIGVLHTEGLAHKH